MIYIFLFFFQRKYLSSSGLLTKAAFLSFFDPLSFLVSRSPVFQGQGRLLTCFSDCSLSHSCVSTVFPFAFPGVNFKRLSSSIQRHFQSSSLALNELDYPKKVAELGKCECLCTVNPSVLSEERKGLDVRKIMEADAPRLGPRGPTYGSCDLGQVI